MGLAIVYSRASAGVLAPLVTVEVHISFGMARFHIVGLAETAVKESRDRVRSALLNTHFEFPGKCITVNLAPADLPKEGGRFDLAIAIGILSASKQLSGAVLTQYEFTGELALSGELRAVRGILPIALGANRSQRKLILPKDNEEEAALAVNAQIFPARHLLEVCAHLKGERQLPLAETKAQTFFAKTTMDIADVKGQVAAKRVLEIAAAGQHSLLFIGPPGTGKTMLASRLTTLLPLLTETQALETAAVASVSMNGFDTLTWRQVPFRAPHHSSSGMALVGGGRPPRPGEISLAHHGVLFLDELPEFTRQVLECLREPLESGHVTISRAAYQSIFPAQFQLVAAMNPCPCGHAGSMTDICRCSEEQIRRYRNKISGPLLDRIDMQAVVPRLSQSALTAREEIVESSVVIQKRVTVCREIQYQRQGCLNYALTVPQLDKYAPLAVSGLALVGKGHG